jgi:hypothetical protein
MVETLDGVTNDEPAAGHGLERQTEAMGNPAHGTAPLLALRSRRPVGLLEAVDEVGERRSAGAGPEGGELHCDILSGDGRIQKMTAIDTDVFYEIDNVFPSPGITIYDHNASTPKYKIVPIRSWR